MRLPPPCLARVGAPLAVAALCLFIFQQQVVAQSGDIAFPAPVFSNEIVGRILPRDVGDARRTRHFYTFRGTEGDVLVTVESSELTGDVDVFVARTLRPLLKVTLYGGTATKATKSFYLRKEETLILRVEARAVGDTEGGYRIILGGSFAPAPPELARAEEPEAPPPVEAAPRKGARRVTATGARIAEPQPEVAEATPTPTPAPPAVEEAKAEEKPAARSEPSRSRRGRGASSAPRRTTSSTPRTKPAETRGESETAEKRAADSPEPVKEKTEREPEAAPLPARTPRARAPRTTGRRPPAPPARAAEATAANEPPPVVTIQRLVIVTKDGRAFERNMNTVRRVTVENNQIVVVMKDGSVVRTPLALVEKMSFEP